MQAVIYALSHRKGGNSDRAADLLRQGVESAGGRAEIMYVRDYDVRPCIACEFCNTATQHQDRKRCVLGSKDQAWDLFAPMFTARTVFFASPIYFYHLPSMAKTWIDRGQQFWRARLDEEPWIADLPVRTAHSVLVAGQPAGKKLFEGTRLTLKYFVKNFKFEHPDPLAYYGIDKAGDLTRKAEFEAEILDLGRKAWSDAA